MFYTLSKKTPIVNYTKSKYNLGFSTNALWMKADALSRQAKVQYSLETLFGQLYNAWG